MSRAPCILAALLAGLAWSGPAEACGAGQGVSRVIEIDTGGGPIFGTLTKRTKEQRFLGAKEVVITFDDGPMPWITRSILDTLEKHCAKATFFQVGRMAVAYPTVTQEILARGHTIGGHTWSHPLNMPRLKAEKAQAEIEKGLAAVSLAAGQPVAPFFRFTGLSDSNALLAYLQSRGIASFTVDVVSDDSFISDPARLARVTIERIEAKKGGIVLFHDIKAATARALPKILAELDARGYRVVHLRAKAPLKPVATFDAELTPLITKALAASGKKQLMPFYGAVGPERMGNAPVTAIAPPARERTIAAAESATDSIYAKRRVRRPGQAAPPAPETGGWSTEVRPLRPGVYER